uniref:Aminotransferase-like plant mobile domain-containing protein n=1 Tax=Setaria italica TaxID=4555 RepID=K3Z0T7_SETIT
MIGTPVPSTGGFPLAYNIGEGGAALTALVDRWRSETHTFHLPFGEMIITLEDISMLFGLRVDGDTVHLLLGVRSEDFLQDVKDRKTIGVSSAWLVQHFGHRPSATTHKGVVARYHGAWLWHMLGIATLAWLYRHMCDASRRTEANSNLGGYAYFLQLWMWERLPIDKLECHGYRNEVEEMELSPMCKIDEEYRRSVCPLICFYIVEYHLPNRVIGQFGKLQTYPPEYNNTGQDLHRVDHCKQRGAKNWEEKHTHAINAWDLRANNRDYGGVLKQNTRLKLKVAMDAAKIEDLPLDLEDVFPKYDEVTRSGRQLERGPFENYIVSSYATDLWFNSFYFNNDIFKFVQGQQLGRFANGVGQALSVPIGSSEEASVLRGFLQVHFFPCHLCVYVKVVVS